MKIIILLILSISLTTVSCSKKKGAAAPTADTSSGGGSGGGGGGGSPTAVTYYPSDSMKYSPSAINSGKTVTSCSCSPAISGVSCSVINSQCILSGTVSGTSSQSTTVNATYSDSTTATSDYIFNYTSTPAVLPAPTITPVATGNSAVTSTGGTTRLTVNSGTTLATPLSFSSDHSVTSCSISPALPAGMTFNTTTCAISGTPSSDISSEVYIPAPGTTYTVTPSNGSTTGTATTFNLVVPVSTSPTLSAVSSSTVTVAGTPTLTAKAGTAVTMSFSANHKVTSCALTGTLPATLLFNTTNCTISGTPTAADYTALAGSSFTITPTGNGGAGSGLAIKIKIYKTWCADHVDDGDPSDGIKSGDGSSTSSPYILCGRDGIIAFGDKIFSSSAERTKYYKLQSNVNLAFSSESIGLTSNKQFKGNFDGSGYTISRQSISSSTGGVYGLFYYADSATIKNLIFNYSSITNPSQGGTIIGNVIGGTTNISDVVIKNSLVNGTTGASGMLVGLVSTGATLNVSRVLVYNSTVPSNSNTEIFVGAIAGTGSVNYLDAIFEDIQTSTGGYLNQSGSPSGIHAVTTNDLQTNSSGTAYFGIASSANWDLTPIKGSGGSPATLILDEEQVYSDGVVH